MAWPSARRAAAVARTDRANRSAFVRGRATAARTVAAEPAAAAIAEACTTAYRSVSPTALPQPACGVLTEADVGAKTTIQGVASVDLFATACACVIAVGPITLATHHVVSGLADLRGRTAFTTLAADVAEEVPARVGRRGTAAFPRVFADAVTLCGAFEVTVRILKDPTTITGDTTPIGVVFRDAAV